MLRKLYLNKPDLKKLIGKSNSYFRMNVSQLKLDNKTIDQKGKI